MPRRRLRILLVWLAGAVSLAFGWIGGDELLVALMVLTGASFCGHLVDEFRARTVTDGPLGRLPLLGKKPFWMGAIDRARGSLSSAVEDTTGALSGAQPSSLGLCDSVIEVGVAAQEAESNDDPSIAV